MYHYNHECFDAYYTNLALEVEGRIRPVTDDRADTMIASRVLGIIAFLSISVASVMILVGAGF